MKEYKQVKENSDLVSYGGNVTDENLDDFDVFFFRQRYNESSQSCIPELKPSCMCRQILNPDDEVAMCPNPECGQYMHLSCLRHNADRKCYECKTEFPAKDLYKLKRTLQQAGEGNEESKESSAHND